ncbi:MAG: dihydrodipicolinate synthase family protein [Bacillota bacterium]|nr:dihydrodipicolinate synthase family protein [Bacillota bacterium]
MKLKGIIPAIGTPMKSDCTIDTKSLKKYVRWLVDQGVHGLAVNADTGEGPHLWPEERKLVIETIKSEIGNKVPIVAGLSAMFTDQAVSEAKAAKEAGADVLLMFPIPAFRGRPQSADMICGYHRRVYEEGGLPMIMFQLQDALGGVEFELDTLERLAKTPGVIAIKEAGFEANKYVRTFRYLREVAPEISLLSGNDNFLAESMVLGADGMLIGFGTLCVKEQVELYNASVCKDWEAVIALGAKVQPLSDFIFSAPVRDYRARTKEALYQMGLFEAAMVRPPLLPLSETEKARVTVALRAAGQL